MLLDVIYPGQSKLLQGEDQNDCILTLLQYK